MSSATDEVRFAVLVVDDDDLLLAGTATSVGLADAMP